MTDPRKALKRIRKRANKASLMIDIGPLSDEDWELCATAARVDVPRLVTALEAVLEMHHVIKVQGAGGHIYEVCQTCNQEYPCRYSAIIADILNGETR